MSSGAEGAAVRVERLSKRFGAVPALHGVGFSVGRGEVFGLVGPDGAGKTTVMRMLAGVMAPDEGSIEVEGTDVVARPEEVRQRISYMPQRFALYEDLTVDENIRFYADVFEVPRRLREERAARLLAASGMSAFRTRLAGQLSGGMKQKLGLTCALIHTPRLLLLDEPTTGVDPVSRREFWQILYGLREEGVTILISTAYLDEAERCTRLALLHRGELRYCDTPDALRKLLPGAMVVIPSEEPARVRDGVARAAGVSAVRVVGDGVRALVDDPARRVPEIEQALRALPGKHGPAAVSEASIEDVFVALLQNDPPGDEKIP
jgi:ABC-2 type transport system ATP-binding protein